MQKKITTSNIEGNSLVGILNSEHESEPLLVFVHGFAGNKEENGLFVDAENYFTARNINTFRFDMAGIGESSGDYSKTSLSKQARDLEAVLNDMRKRYTANNISIVGFSLGATISTLIDPKLVNQYIFWSPAIFTAKDMHPKYITDEVLAEMTSKGYLDKGGVKIGKKIIQDFKEYNPLLHLKNITSPVLLIHGTEDPRIDYNSTREAQKLFSDATFVKIDGANHSYKNNQVHRNKLFTETYSWLVNEIYKK